MRKGENGMQEKSFRATLHLKSEVQVVSCGKLTNKKAAMDNSSCGSLR